MFELLGFMRRHSCNVGRSFNISQLYPATKYFKRKKFTVIVQIKNEKKYVAEIGRREVHVRRPSIM